MTILDIAFVSFLFIIGLFWVKVIECKKQIYETETIMKSYYIRGYE